MPLVRRKSVESLEHHKEHMHMMSNDSPEIPTEIIAETDNYAIVLVEDPDGEVTYNLQLGPVTVHFFPEEWDEFVEMIDEAGEPETIEGEEEQALEVELDWGSLYFTREEWDEFRSLLAQVKEE